MMYKIGEFVIQGGDIVRICDRKWNKVRGPIYGVAYCQFQDPDRGESGGRGYWSEQPELTPLVKPEDVMFAEAVQIRERYNAMQTEVDQLKADYEAVKRARQLILNKPRAKELP